MTSRKIFKIWWALIFPNEIFHEIIYNESLKCVIKRFSDTKRKWSADIKPLESLDPISPCMGREEGLKHWWLFMLCFIIYNQSVERQEWGNVRIFSSNKLFRSVVPRLLLRGTCAHQFVIFNHRTGWGTLAFSWEGLAPQSFGNKFMVILIILDGFSLWQRKHEMWEKLGSARYEENTLLIVIVRSCCWDLLKKKTCENGFMPSLDANK